MPNPLTTTHSIRHNQVQPLAPPADLSPTGNNRGVATQSRKQGLREYRNSPKPVVQHGTSEPHKISLIPWLSKSNRDPATPDYPLQS